VLYKVFAALGPVGLLDRQLRASAPSAGRRGAFYFFFFLFSFSFSFSFSFLRPVSLAAFGFDLRCFFRLESRTS
jgi:hypothetical protein